MDRARNALPPGVLSMHVLPAEHHDRDWDAIIVSREEAGLLATNGLVLGEGRVIVDADNKRVIGELRKRGMDVIPLPFDGPIATGGGLRCAHHPLLRESVLG